MTVTLHPRPGERMADLVRDLARLTGGDMTAVRTGRSGVVVNDDLARAYLWAGPDSPPAGPVEPQMVPPALRAKVQRAEAPLTAHSPSTAAPPAHT